MRVLVGPAGSIPPGTVKIIYPAKVPAGVGVFNLDGEFCALKNVCPHMGAPLCRGQVTGAGRVQIRADGVREVAWSREGEVITCPWHHWEFDIRTGETLFPSRNRVRRYPVGRESEDADAASRLEVEDYPVFLESELIYVEL
jgi:nitrite reductase (NADH) small subunit